MNYQRITSQITYGFLFLSILFLFGCNGNCEFQVSDIKSIKSKIYVGETLDLSIDVHNPSSCNLEYKWKASNEKMNPETGFSNSKFKAPCETGLNRIVLDIQNKGETLMSKSIEIEVIEKKPYDISTDYEPSGFFDDINSISMKRTEHQKKICTEFIFRPTGQKGYGGVYWQSPANNWGANKGKDLSGYEKVSFYVCSPDNATINFIAGGISDANLPNKDKFKRSTGFKKLSLNWEKLEIDLKGADLSSVIGGLAWTTNKQYNPSTIRFYIRDIIYERFPCK